MAVRDDTADWIASEVTAIGLGTDASTEVDDTDNGYERLTPDYAPAEDGVAVLEGTLEFDGPENSDISHALFYRGSSLWFSRPLSGDVLRFNSDGRWDLEAAPITVTLAGA